MEELNEKLNKLIDSLKKEHRDEIKERLNDLVCIYPFNEYEFMISTLMGYKKLSLDDYYELRDNYIKRNLYLFVFEISAPRGFGEKWAQGNLKTIIPELKKPLKETDPNYKGQYDFYLDDKIRIEVKASRAVDFDSSDKLVEKALDSKSKKRFDMNFQQIKTKCCDVFVWIAVWRDVIRYWVLASDEVKNNNYYSAGQHRGNKGEGQLHLKHDNIKEFDKYETKVRELLENIREAYKRQKGEKNLK